MYNFKMKLSTGIIYLYPAKYSAVDAPQASLYRVSSTGPFVFRIMPTLLPRKTSQAASVIKA